MSMMPSLIMPSLILMIASMVLIGEAKAQVSGPLVLPGAVPPAAEVPPDATRRAPQRPRGESTQASTLPRGIKDAKHYHHGSAPGTQGELEIIGQLPGTLGLHITATGRVISSPGETCAIDLGADSPAPMLRIEERYRTTRYRLQSPVCPLVVELLPNSVRISIPDGECAFVRADCRLSPDGVWGPTAEDLMGRTAAIERQRGRAENEMRDTSRKLLRRLSGEDQRQVAAEQAAFSSERTTTCRSYVGEDQHGFCAAELTSARVEHLKQRYEQTPERPPRNR